MRNLLIELLIEEMPYKSQNQYEDLLCKFLQQGLVDNFLGYNSIDSFSTPRRLSFIIRDIPDKQEDSIDERKGPKVSSSEQVLNGFFKSLSITADNCEVRDNAYYYVKHKKGDYSKNILPNIITDSINKISWSKSMRFADETFRCIRPLRSIVAVLGDEVLNGGLKIGMNKKLYFKDKVSGHRFMSKGEFVVNADNYEQLLRDNYVILSRKERLDIINSSFRDIYNNLGISLIEDEALLNEISGLVEYPVVLVGEIDACFMSLPSELLITSIRKHQKFFAFTDNKTGKLSKYFGLVSNIETKDNGELIIKGNQRVLRARLADSEFFWKNDLNKKLENNVSKLDNIVFESQLGSLGNLVTRLINLSSYIATIMLHAL